MLVSESIHPHTLTCEPNTKRSVIMSRAVSAKLAETVVKLNSVLSSYLPSIASPKRIEY